MHTRLTPKLICQFTEKPRSAFFVVAFLREVEFGCNYILHGEAGIGQEYVPKSDVPYELWNRLIGVNNPVRTGIA